MIFCKATQIHLTWLDLLGLINLHLSQLLLFIWQFYFWSLSAVWKASPELNPEYHVRHPQAWSNLQGFWSFLSWKVKRHVRDEHEYVFPEDMCSFTPLSSYMMRAGVQTEPWGHGGAKRPNYDFYSLSSLLKWWMIHSMFRWTASNCTS